MFARTDRLLLRPSWPEDSEAIFHAINDAAIVENLACIPWPNRRQDAESFTSPEQYPLYPKFLIAKRTAGAQVVIGGAGIFDDNGLPAIGFWIARPYWGLGYASEAACAVVDIAKALGHKKLRASYFADNPASGHVLSKLGFNPCGRKGHRYCVDRQSKAPIITLELDIKGTPLGHKGLRAEYLGHASAFIPYDADEDREAA